MYLRELRLGNDFLLIYYTNANATTRKMNLIKIRKKTRLCFKEQYQESKKLYKMEENIPKTHILLGAVSRIYKGAKNLSGLEICYSKECS